MATGHVGAQDGARRNSVSLGARRWTATLMASVVTTYALDFVATSAGLLVVASQLLSGLSYAEALLLLAGSYVAWGAGLWAMLKANWDLLQRTGASTNLLSKAAHDIAARFTLSVRWRRAAADTGYVATELAKEAPYYLGAAGAALFTDSISAVDAIVFLAGANVGAAAYEFALARGMRFVLGRFVKGGYASFDTEWRPRAYLDEYYGSVEPDEQRTIAFFVDALQQVEPGRRILVFGVGPTLHHVFLAAEKASEIHLADYLPENLREIERWLSRERGAHDWRQFIRFTLQCEGLDSPTERQIADREELTRRRITRLLAADLRRPCPLVAGLDQPYDIVVSAYCADCATGDRAEWGAFMHRLLGLVGQGGFFMTAALRRTDGYLVAGRLFPSACIDERDLRGAMEQYCNNDDVMVEVASTHATAAKGYSSIILAHGWRRAPASA